MVRRRSACTALVLALAAVATILAGCVPTTPPHTSTNVQEAYVLQHTVTLTVAAGQTASATASCASGEHLVSGGYSTNDVLDYQKPPQVVGNYPSDSSGTPPSASGKAEDSWTVRVSNASAATISYNVVANCLTGPMVAAAGVSTRVWLQPIGQDQPAVSCPNDTVLTGGGYLVTPPEPLVAPNEPLNSVVYHPSQAGSQAWLVTPNGQSTGDVYAVCATNVNPGTSVTAEFRHNHAVKQVAPGHYQGLISIACPSDETLVGGGFLGIDGRLQPWSHLALADGDSSHWQVAFEYIDAGDGSDSTPAFYAAGAVNWEPWENGGMGVCVVIPTAWNGKVNITFSNYHHLLRIPADVIVATDGSGQIRAGKLTARVSQVRSKSLAATKTINPFTGGVSYTVPSGCGSPNPAIDAATSAVTSQRKRTTPPAGQTAFGSPIVTIDHNSLTCSPQAGTQRTVPFTYTQAIDATSIQGTYDPKTVVSYQHNQLQKATQALGSPYVIRDTLICSSGPKLLSANSTRATLQCSAYGVAEWPWSTDQLHTLAQSLAGKTQAEAQHVLDTTPGIVTHSAVIDLPQLANGIMPANASDITIILVRTQDTAPVIRAP